MPIVELPVVHDAFFGQARSRVVRRVAVRATVPVRVPDIRSDDSPCVFHLDHADDPSESFRIRVMPGGRPFRSVSCLPDLDALARLASEPVLPFDYPEANAGAAPALYFDARAPEAAAVLAGDSRLRLVDPDPDARSQVWSGALERCFALVDGRVWQAMATMPALRVSATRDGRGVRVGTVLDVEASRRAVGPPAHHFPLHAVEAAEAFAAGFGGCVPCRDGPWTVRVVDRALAEEVSQTEDDLARKDAVARTGIDSVLLGMSASRLVETAPPREIVAALRELAVGGEGRLAAIAVLHAWGSLPGAPKEFASYARARDADVRRTGMPSPGSDPDDAAIASMRLL